MPRRFFINRIEHIHTIDEHIRLRSVYVLLFPICERAIAHHYVTQQNIYINLLVSIETGVADLNVLSVLEV